MLYLEDEKLPVTDGEEGGVGEASFTAGDTEGGVEERTLELEGAASSESPCRKEVKLFGLGSSHSPAHTRWDSSVSLPMLLLRRFCSDSIERSASPSVLTASTLKPWDFLCLCKRQAQTFTLL